MTAPAEEQTKPYGRCKDCNLELADRPAVDAHLKETFTGIGSSHSVEIVNPTEAEQQVSRVRIAIDDVLVRACEELYDQVERGRMTLEEVKAQIGFFDLEEAWDDYVREGES
jgi:hypothetical protein